MIKTFLFHLCKKHLEYSDDFKTEYLKDIYKLRFMYMIDDAQEKHPIKFFFLHELPVHLYNPKLIFQTLSNSFSNLKYWFMYRYVQKHQYHKIDTRLKPGYYDYDTRLLHGCFSLLCEFIEESKYYIDIVDHEDPENIKFLELYNWWITERPKRKEQKIDYGTVQINSKEFMIEIMNCEEQEQAWYKEDTEKLKELIELRSRLWF